MQFTLESQASALELIKHLARQYPDIPLEAIVKEDLLRRGMAWSQAALEVSAGYKRKAYFIFCFDMVPISDMGQDENMKAPEEVRLAGGAYGFRPVVVSVRLNPDSAHRKDKLPPVLKHLQARTPTGGPLRC